MSSDEIRTKSERDNTLDILKGIGIFLVVIGHTTQNTMIHNFIYSFHRPLFFILSGFTFGKYGNYILSLKDYVLKKIKTLLIPYFLWGG